ncbi:MAG: thioredoxin domain-containing protein [Chloroflexota bacterium]|nr:thioredoxin domain-containing protein [Chloroflexota bacterium]
MTNYLVQETSPYLLQHADNPVDWYPWGEQALQKAKAEDKPIFLSIGYSACHWCHVMAHESFEDESVAEIMNANFVNIKVDREERPDLDRIYMSAVQALTGRGGWPMSVFLTPDGEPFFGGTYFPPTARHGMASFSDILLSVNNAWQNQRQRLIADSQKLVDTIQTQAVVNRQTEEPLNDETLEAAFQKLSQSFDNAHGGCRGAPKFPQPMALEFLLRYHYTTDDPQAKKMVSQTLEAMARGGMYDQLGGGFHRYSVDDHWLVPHFEKMLYDNAQLARVYLHAWQVTENSFFRTITEEILDYVLREMTCPEGGFYSTQDADSEGEEGKFFVWTTTEIHSLLGEDADAFIAAYGITESGNFEGKNILEFLGKINQRSEFALARRKLLAVREGRVHPGRDEKIITSWNGLMLAAFAEAAQALDRDDYRNAALKNANFILTELRNPEGRLWHTWKDSAGKGTAKINGYLDDYAHLIEGLLELYQSTFNPRWYQAAQELAEEMIAHFSTPEGGFFDTSDDHEKLITRPRGLQDNAVPSGNAMAAGVLAKLAGFTVEPSYLELVHRSLKPMQPMLSQHPLGFGQWLLSLDYALSQPREIAIIGRQTAPDTQALLEIATQGYQPHQIVALATPQTERVVVPVSEGRAQLDDSATAYVCTNFTCLTPITDQDELQELLDKENLWT